MHDIVNHREKILKKYIKTLFYFLPTHSLSEIQGTFGLPRGFPLSDYSKIVYALFLY